MITDDIINNTLEIKKKILSNGIVQSMTVAPQAIYLVGGYGRGEGAWYEDESGLHPYNDFDLAVITETPLSHEQTEELRKRLANEVDIKWVDIDFYSFANLKNMTPSIHNVDLINGCSLIYGEDIIRDNGYFLDSTKIGKEDLLLLYRTRIWTFLGSWMGPFRKLNDKEARFFKNQMAKAILAACDMKLIKLKRYTTSYVERAKIVIEEFNFDDDFCQLVSWAIKEKIRPSQELMDKDDMQTLYFKVKKEFVKSFEFALEKDAHYFLNPNETFRYYLWHTKYYLYHLLSLLMHGKSNEARGLDIFFAMNYVFRANEGGIIDNEMLKKASALLLRHGYIKEISDSWDELRVLTANARNNI